MVLGLEVLKRVNMSSNSKAFNITVVILFLFFSKKLGYDTICQVRNESNYVMLIIYFCDYYSIYGLVQSEQRIIVFKFIYVLLII